MVSSAARRWQERLRFIAAIARKPKQTGAISPSSHWLAKAIVESMPEREHPTVVELGAGAGALTGSLLERTGSGGRLLSLEVDPDLARYVSGHFPQAEVWEADAADLSGILEKAGAEQVQAVVSALPWSLFPPDKQRVILEQARDALAPDGTFVSISTVTAGLTAAGRLFPSLLPEYFAGTGRRFVPGNFPPAYVYVGWQPVRRGGTQRS
ncbi:methyltransferase domain-containing protein [Streptomyces sp. ODS28]|uniref:class I SAM-dependent methyltransferase n=1 Tax=Streptomyces sp. ODS28 TaxID=3136688 RepID=UPI0031EF5E8C